MNKSSSLTVVRIARFGTTAVLLVCVLATFLSVSAVFASSGMSCCAGKEAGHCHAKLRVRKPKPEPLCGAKVSVENDAADEISSTVENASRISVASNKVCDRECSGCATSQTKQQKRFGTGVVVELNTPSLARWDKQTHLGNLSNSSHIVEPFSPRGPPFLS